MFSLCSQIVPGLNVGHHYWTVSSPAAAAAVAKLLEHEQPSRLVVDIPDSVPSPPELRQLVESVKRHHDGELQLCLWHSYLTFTNCDDILTELRGARLEDNLQQELRIIVIENYNYNYNYNYVITIM